MSKRRFFLLDEDISLSVKPRFGNQASVKSVLELMKGADDTEVIEKANDLAAVLVTNDAGLVKRYRSARRRKTHDECYPGLIHLASDKALVQERMLRYIIPKYVWNEMLEQDFLIRVWVDEQGKVQERLESLCHHTNYERKPITRRQKK